MEVVFLLLLFSLLTTNGAMTGNSGEDEIDEYKLQKLSIVGLKTKQSSTYEENNIVYSSENAADGDTENSIAITKLDGNPAWSVHLKEEHCIGKVTLYNRADCCSDRLKLAIVRAGVSFIPNRNERCGTQVKVSQAQEPGGVIDVYCDPPLLAKMISVVLPYKQHLQLVEVTVEEYPLQRCHRPQRRVSILQELIEQSSLFDRMFPAWVAADGYISTLHDQGFACTARDFDPWWKVTLPKDHCISKVTLYNRFDCCSDRLTDAVVRAGMSPDIHSNAPCGSPITASQAQHLGGVMDVYCGPPLMARFVSVDIPGREEHLHLREVEIEELNVEPCGSDERDFSIIGKPTKQSSSYDERYSSDKAADGNRDPQVFAHYRCTHTKHEVDPWWLVDLEDEHCISRVVVLNRGDCCSDRLTNAIVRAGTSTNIHANPQCGGAVSSDMAAPIGGTIEFICNPPLVARYVSVDIPSDAPSFLQLCEVTVKELITEGACREPGPTVEEKPTAPKRVQKKEVDATTEKPIPKKVDVATEKPIPKKVDVATEKPIPKKVGVATEKPIPKKVGVATEKPIPKKVDVATEKPIPKKVDVATEKPVTKKRKETHKQKYTVPHGIHP